MADIKLLAETLQDAEVTVLNILKSKKQIDTKDLVGLTKLDLSSIERAALWLQNKKLVDVSEQSEEMVEIADLCQQYLKSGLPEKRFLESVKKPTSMKDLSKSLNPDEVKFCIGHLKGKGLITFANGNVCLTEDGKTCVGKKTDEEKLIEKIVKPTSVKALTQTEKSLLELLIRRNLIKKFINKTRTLKLTTLGEKVSAELKTAEKRIGILTPQILKAGSWKKEKFRRYDVEASVPAQFAGKRQAYLAFLDEVKEKLTAMGFQEMSGPIVEQEFFNNDALYMPQDHPARGIHDAYFVKDPKIAQLKSFEKQLQSVKKIHEKGGFDSTGWNMTFNTDQTKRTLLRSQTTAVSARMLMNPELKIPGKYFTINRVYRPEKLDATHLTEFNQMEGIILGKDLNFSQLLGLMKEFATQLTGSDKIKFTPVAYFPFTEPSVTAYMFHPKLNKWIEVMPAGVFRPEVTKPLGIDDLVLDWGFGIDRLFMIKENITDIRQLFSQDIDWLREAKI